MKLHIIHVSDIHFHGNENSNFIEHRAISFANAIGSYCSNNVQTILIVTGDIAFSGKKNEYSIAELFFLFLKDYLFDKWKLNIDFLFIPGNHDCDFSISSVRSMVIEKIENIENISEIHIDEEIVKQCVSVQDEFFQFCNLMKASFGNTVHSKLITDYPLEVGKEKILFRLINSAWMSILKERPGRLLLPVKWLDINSENTFNLVISCIHHPYNWFKPDNSRSLRKNLEYCSDIILTGHEHDGLAFTRLSNSSINEYVEGSVFLDSENIELSSFSLITLDTDTKQYLVRNFYFDLDIYSPYEETYERVFQRNRFCIAQMFVVSDSFANELEELGIRFSHPRKNFIQLSDLFVYPDVRVLENFKRKNNSRTNPLDLVLKEKRVLFIGPEKSGKTSLAKKLFIDINKFGYVTIFVDACIFKPSSSKQLEPIIKNIIAQQYSSQISEKIFQLPPEKKAIIIDDFHRSSLKLKARTALINQLNNLFSIIVLLGTEEVRWQELDAYNAESREDAPLLLQYCHADILPLGYMKQSDLIERWVTLGRSNVEFDNIELDKQKKHYEMQLYSLLGKGLIPPFPIYILLLLQRLDISESSDNNMGSQGYLYEVLITHSLSKTSKGNQDIDLRYKYLSEMSGYFYENNRKEISSTELQLWHNRYIQEFCVALDYFSTINGLVESSILRHQGEGIAFAYPYLFHYFLARFIRDHLSENHIREIVKEMASALHLENNTKVMIFLCYLSKDSFVLNSVIDAANKLFANQQECDFDKQTMFLNSLMVETPQLVLEAESIVDPEKNRQKELAERDQMQDSDDIPYETGNGIQEILDMNASFHTIRIMGQILRNFYGSLSGENKIKLCETCLSVGFRVLGFILGIVENNGTTIIKDLAGVLLKLHPEATKERIGNDTSKFIFSLCERSAFSTMKMLSESIGLEELEPVYKKVIQEDAPINRCIVETTIKMDYMIFPKSQIISTFKKWHHNTFVASLIRHLVWYHFYVTREKYYIRQEVCQKLGIILEKSFIENSQKLIPTQSEK